MTSGGAENPHRVRTLRPVQAFAPSGAGLPVTTELVVAPDSCDDVTARAVLPGR
ncbi:MAG: hypothetical protein WKF57_17695 [Nakamurella sp.]